MAGKVVEVAKLLGGVAAGTYIGEFVYDSIPRATRRTPGANLLAMSGLIAGGLLIRDNTPFKNTGLGIMAYGASTALLAWRINAP